MSTADDLPSELHEHYERGCYFPNPEVEVDRTSGLRTIHISIYLVDPNGSTYTLPSRKNVSSIYQSFKTNLATLKSIPPIPVKTEITDIWQSTCLSYAYGPAAFPRPPIMAEEPGSPYEQWFKLTAAPLPECTHEEAATEEGAAQAAE